MSPQVLRSPLSSTPGGGSPTPGFLPVHRGPRRLARVLPVRSRAFDSDRDRAALRGWNGFAGVGADVATLGNLCVDVVLSVPCLPPKDKTERKRYMERLAASPPDKKHWEAGGNCNLAIAAARIGLRCVALGHVGDEIYGDFLLDVLQEEGISMVAMNEDLEASQLYNASYETLLCWVLVDSFQRHGFCSRADFITEPAFSWMTMLSRPVRKAIEQSKILFCNGYVFDELYPTVIISALDCAMDAGTAVFFDPGPRGKTLSNGSIEERRAMEQFLKLSDVLLFTSEEAEALTGIGNPIQAGKRLLDKGIRVKWVIIKMGPKGSILITKSSISGASGFKVNVLDTVGCGDSFTAAVAFGFLCNMPAINTITLANAVGAATATGVGAGRNVATLEKVLQLLRVSHLNEDESWKLSIQENSSFLEIILLSKFAVNGSGGRISHVSVDKVISDLLPKLEAMNEGRMCHLER